MKFSCVIRLAVLITPFMLSACGSSSSSSVDDKSLDVSPSLGKITKATAILYQSDSTTQLASSEIGTDGKIDISYAGSYSGPVIVVVKGDSDATYFDEATGTELAFGAGKMLRAVVPAGTTETAVTILTEMAYQLSLINSIPITNATVNQLNERVRAAIAPELSSITAPPLLFDSTTTAGDLDDDEAGKYALRLAALAKLGASDATPALTIAEQLAKDFADGTLDGQASGSAIVGALYNPATIAADLTTELSSFAASYGSTALQNALSDYSSIATSVDIDDLIPSDTGGTLPSYVAGQIVTMKYCCAASDSPYSTDDEVLFSFSSSGRLMLTDQYTVVAASFTERGSEYIWVDNANSIEYALSVLNDAIHEVNVQSIGGSTFYGQFTPVEEDTSGETLEPNGDGSALSGGNGATGTIGLNTYTYTGAGTSGEDSLMYVYNPLTDYGAFIVYDGTDPLTRWQIGGLTNSLGSFECSDESLVSVMLTIDGVANLASECVINILSVSPTEIEGRFAAVLYNTTDVQFGTVTDGYFRYEVPEQTSTGGLGADEFGYSMDVDGSNVTDADVPALDGADRQVADYLSLGDTPVFKINMIPEGVGGVYTCGQGPNSYRLVSMYYQGYTTDGDTYPGSCSVTVDYTGEVYSGTFSGTLYNSDGDEMVITNGEFRNDGSELNDDTSGGGETSPMLDMNDTSFQSNADAALAEKAETSGSGAIYMDIQDNDESGGSHYWDDDPFVMAMASISSFNGALVFKQSNFMANTIGFKDVLTETSGDIDCVDSEDDVGTSDYDVFGYSAYIAPNTLKPYSNDSCVFNLQYDGSSETYTGQGSAKAHYYDNGAATYYIRDLRFKFVYKP